MTRLFRARNLLDEKFCWKEWQKPKGSLLKVITDLNSQGKLNPDTGRPFTPSGIQKAAFRWALDNIEEARRDVEYKLNTDGRTLSERAWKEFLYDMTKLACQTEPRKFERYVAKLGLQGYAPN